MASWIRESGEEAGGNEPETEKVLISLTISAVVLTAVCILGAPCADAARATDFSKKNLAPSLNCLFGTDWMGRDMLVNAPLRGLSISILLGILVVRRPARSLR